LSGFSSYMSQSASAWSRATAQGLSDMWNGTLDANLTTLSSLVADGHFFSGGGVLTPTGLSVVGLNDWSVNITAAYYSYAIPAVWSVSAYPVVVDAGYGCSGNTPKGSLQDMDATDQANTLVCVNGSAYYLAVASG